MAGNQESPQLERAETKSCAGSDADHVWMKLAAATAAPGESTVEKNGTEQLNLPDLALSINADSYKTSDCSSKAAQANALEKSLHGFSSDFAKAVRLDKFNYADLQHPQHKDLSFPTSPTPIPSLPARYLPVQEKFSGTKVTGISREFLKNLQTDDTGQYYGAGLRYPDIQADPEMQKFIDASNKATLSRIDKSVYDQELSGEKKASSYKLPPGWDSTPSGQSLNAVDLSVNDGDQSFQLGSQSFTVTSDGAPNRKLVTQDFSDPSGVRTVIAEPKDFVIEQVIGVTVNGANKFAVVGCNDGANVLYVYDAGGKQESQIPLPGYGALHDVRQGSNDSELQFLYDTPISAPRVLTLDLKSDKADFSPLSKDAFNTDDFVTEKLMVPYADREGKTQDLPVYVSHNKNVKLDGKNPAIFDVYGGFDIAPQWLRYYPSTASWLARGGIVVDPVLPGDGGRGSANFKAGLAQGIENTNLALIAAVEKVQNMGLTAPETTGIYGRSNGGMVVNSTLNRRPDLFGAAVSESGVDSLFDSPKLNVDTGKYWQDEFGNPSSSQQVGWMSKLDVLSNVSAAKHYPPTLIELGTRDGVVNVGNGISYANIRQKMNNGETLMYFREGEGHDPNSLDLQTAFLWNRLTTPAGK